jgi:hypothetical protein
MNLNRFFVSEKNYGIINFKSQGVELTADDIIFIVPKNYLKISLAITIF